MVEKIKKEKQYCSPLFNKTTLKVSDLKTSSNSTTSVSNTKTILSPKLYQPKETEKNSFNDNLIKFSKINGNPKLDTFLQTYDRIANSIRIGYNNENIIPEKRTISLNKKVMNELTNNGTHRNISLNVNPYISMTPIINHLLKYVEVVVKDKAGNEDNNSSHSEKDDELLKKEDKNKIIIDAELTELSQPPLSDIRMATEKNTNSEEITESSLNVLNQYNAKDLTLKNRNINNNNMLKVKGKLNLLQTSNSIKELYNSISHDLSVLENITKSDKDQLEPLSYSNDQSDTLFITNQNIEISGFIKEHINIEENGNSIDGILPKIDSKAKLNKDIMNNSELSTESTTINKTTLDKTLINDTPLNKERRYSSPMDHSFNNININSYPNYSKLTHSNNNNINIKNNYNNDGNKNNNNNNNINVNNDKDSPFPFNPPVLLRRRSSLSRSRSRTRSSSLGDRKNINQSNAHNPVSDYDHNETADNTRHSRYSLLYNSNTDSDKPEKPDKPYINNDHNNLTSELNKSNVNNGGNNINFEKSKPGMIDNKLVPPKLTNRISSIGKVNKNDINNNRGNVNGSINANVNGINKANINGNNNTNVNGINNANVNGNINTNVNGINSANVNGNINANVNHDVNREKIKRTSIINIQNGTPNNVQNNGIPNGNIINGHMNRNHKTSNSNEQPSDKRSFANITNFSKSFNEDSSNKRHSINVTNMSKSFNEDNSNKRHSINVTNITRIDGNRTPKFRFSKIDESTITPTNSHSPKIDEESSTSSGRLTPKSNKDKRYSLSSMAIEVPNKPDQMVKQKAARKSKTLSLINLLSPKSSLSEISQKTSNSDLDDSHKSELHLPSKILFDDDLNSFNNSSINSSNIDSDVQTTSSKNKRFSIAKLTGKMIKKTNNKESKKNSKDNISVSSKRSGIKHYRGNYFGFADEEYDEEEGIEEEGMEENKIENDLAVNSTHPSKSINDHRNISHTLVQNDKSRSPLIKANDDHKYEEVSASSFKIIKHDKIEKKPLSDEGIKSREINNQELKSKDKKEKDKKTKDKKEKVKKEKGKMKGKKPAQENENKSMNNDNNILNNNDNIKVIKVNNVNEIIYYNNLCNSGGGGDDDEWIDESILSKNNNTRVKKKQSIRNIDPAMRKNTSVRAKKEQRLRNEEPGMVKNNNNSNNSNNNSSNNNNTNNTMGVKKDTPSNGGDDEWIDESVLEKGNIKKEVRKQQSTRSLKRREQSIRRRGQSKHKRKPTGTNKYNTNLVSSNSRKLESNPSILEKTDKVDRRDLSHGSIHYARSTTKFTVVKSHSIRNGNSAISSPMVNSRNSSINNTPALHTVVINHNDSNNNSRIYDQSSLAKDIDTNRNTSYRQPITINEPTTQISSPNQSFILSKGDVSFSSMSVVSRVSSVKMKRNIIKRFFHMNLRKKNNKRKNKK